MDDQNPCIYTIYSPQQCICQSPQSAISEQVAQMNMNTRLQTMQIEQAMQFQTDMINQSINSILPYHNSTACCATFNRVDSSMCQYMPPKQESWIERLDRLIFPENPIRDWVESEIERISREYAWIDEV